MAIQIGGTTVVNNSRALKNIASVDSTTAASITAAGVGGGGATSVSYGSNTSNIPFGFVSSHTRNTRDLEPGGMIFSFDGPGTVYIYKRPSPTSSSGQTTLATGSKGAAYVNTGSSTLPVWVSGASKAFVFNF